MTVKRIGELFEGKNPAERRTNPTYGRVFFALRRRFGLSAQACLLVDVIETLSRRTGWCFASRDYLASLLGVSVSSVKRLLAELEGKELVERHPADARQVRPAERWRRARLVCESGQSDPTAGSI
jgi:DNA-binding MarR family transcriptional regulator